MKYARWRIRGLLVIVVSITALSQQFTNLSRNKGLSQSSVLSLLQDKYGFLWIGTQDGLNRYNGSDFEIYRHDFSDSLSISANEVQDIIQSRDGNYWFATPYGISILKDPLSKKFTRISHSPTDSNSLVNNYCQSILQDRDGIIWIGTSNGLSIYNPKTKIFRNLQNRPNQKKVLPFNSVYKIYEDSFGNIIICTGSKVALYNFESKTFESLEKLPSSNTVFQDSQKQLWFGTVSKGLVQFDLKQRKIIKEVKTSFSNVLVIEEYKKNELWLGTSKNGIILYNSNTGKQKKLHHQENDNYSLLDNKVYSLKKGSHDIMWVGTRAGGLSKYDPNAVFFKHMTQKAHLKNTLSSKIVWSILEDQNENIWVGTDTGGLNRIDAKSKKVTLFRHQKNNLKTIPQDKVISLLESKDGTIWAATESQGLAKIDPKSFSIKRIAAKDVKAKYMSFNYVQQIVEDKNEILWLATLYGLYRFDPKTQKSRFFLPDTTKGIPMHQNSINFVLIDNNQFWIATQYGALYRFDPQSGSFTAFEKAKQFLNEKSYIMSLHRDSYNQLWVGTLEGLVRINLRTDKVQFYGLSDGLPNECIYGIVSDSKDGIWLSTNNGIVKVHHIDEEELCIDSFDYSNNIQSREFNQFAFSRGKSGRLYFGGVNGFNIIDKSVFSKKTYEPKTFISKLKVLNEDYPITINPKKLELPYSKNLIQFEFLALQYTDPDKIQYEYRLDGFTNEWIKLGRKNFINFMNLSGAEYKLEVRSYISESEKNNIASIKFRIVPPFWKTPSFYLSITALLILFIIFAIRYKLQSVRRENKRLEGMVNERTEVISEKMQELVKANVQINETQEELIHANSSLGEALNELTSERQKNKTMIEILVHDLKNPLNNILTLTRHRPEKDELETIHQAGNQILNLSMNLLETSKFEHQAMQLELGHHNIYKLSMDAYSQVRFLAKQKNISFKNNIDPSLFAHIDYEIILRVFINTFTNSIKNTFYGGEIELSSKLDSDSKVFISVSDNGRGIPKDKLEHIFDKYAQVENKKLQKVRSSGLGLTFCKLAIEKHQGKIWVESEEGEFTRFTFSLTLSSVQNSETSKESFEDLTEQIDLNADDYLTVETLIQKLRDINIYDSSEILDCIDSFNPPNDRIKKWLKQLKFAALNLEEDHYKALLKQPVTKNA